MSCYTISDNSNAASPVGQAGKEEREVFKMLDYIKVIIELWKRAGYRERRKLVYNSSKKIHKVQDGLYSFAGIEFTYGMAGYEDFTIINS